MAVMGNSAKIVQVIGPTFGFRLDVVDLGRQGQALVCLALVALAQSTVAD